MLIRIFLCLFCSLAGLHGQEHAGGQVVLDAAAKESVQGAVQALGNQVLQSNFAYAIERMYPRWRIRQAKRLGSEQKLLETFNNAGAQMQEMGITIDSFSALDPGVAYHVHPKMKDGVERIESSDDLLYEVLVVVPTRMKMSFMLEGQAKRSFMRESFQIAVSVDGQNDWSFIDGATIRVVDLRSLFPLLPQDLKLPEKRDVEIK
jgi:hypothetical protein